MAILGGGPHSADVNRSLNLGDLVDNTAQSAVNPDSLRTLTAMPLRNGGNREVTDCDATLNIREIVRVKLKTFLSKFSADNRTHAARLT